ncbi:MAG: YCF48-related protein [Balneolaceae bacterium]
MRVKIVFIVLITVLGGCGILGDNGNNYEEPDGWFTVLSDSLVSFNDDENFQELDVSNLFFLDENHGWVTGRLQRNGPDKAFAASTNDGGRNWKFNFIDNYTRAGDPFFFDMEKGIMAGNVIHRTSDGGSSWTHRMIQSGEPAVGVTTVKFQNQFIGWATGPFGAIAKTTDSGVTWNYLDLGYNEDRFESISIVGNDVWILGAIDPGRLIKTSDGGESWQNIPLPSRGEDDPLIRFDKVHFINKSNGWLVGSYRHIFHTADGGNTWTLQYPQTDEQIDTDSIISINALDSLNVLALTSAGAILSSKNGGQSWGIQVPKNNNSINTTIQFISENVAYAINGNRVFKTVTRGEK